MGDMGDYFRDAKAFFKEKRQGNFEAAQARMQEVSALIDAPIFQDPNNGTWKTRFLGQTLLYYPTRGKWQIKNKVYHGGIDSFVNWLKNQQALAAQERRD